MLQPLAAAKHFTHGLYLNPKSTSNKNTRHKFHAARYNKNAPNGRRRSIPSALSRLRGNRNDLTALCLSNLLVVEPAITDCEVFVHAHRPPDIIKTPQMGVFIISGGEEGIRTLDTVARIHDFESRAFDHSATSPWRLLYLFSFYLQGVYNRV